MTAAQTSYAGPQCPRCDVPLAREQVRTGLITCVRCRTRFEATAFEPPRRRHRTVEQIIVAGPEGASACANHARNAAVTSCDRCGLFICSLCEMSVGGTAHCPSCFDHLRAEGSLHAGARKYRDYASMAYVASLVGFLFSFLLLGLPFGALAIYYAVKGRRQRREEGRSTAGMVMMMIIGALEVLSSIAFAALLIFEVMK